MKAGAWFTLLIADPSISSNIWYSMCSTKMFSWVNKGIHYPLWALPKGKACRLHIWYQQLHWFRVVSCFWKHSKVGKGQVNCLKHRWAHLILRSLSLYLISWFLHFPCFPYFSLHATIFFVIQNELINSVRDKNQNKWIFIVQLLKFSQMAIKKWEKQIRGLGQGTFSCYFFTQFVTFGKQI